MKRLLLLPIVALGLVSVCGAAWAAEAPAVKFKTGKYDTCIGTEEECRQHKGFTGGDELYFEKNHIGRSVFKFEESPFLWKLEGNILHITPYVGDPYQMEVKDDSTLLADKREEVFYRLIEEEDAAFVPGVYFQCAENTVESCVASLDDFSEFLLEDTGSSYTFMMLYEKDESQFCPKESKDCVALEWQRTDDDTHVVATLEDPGKSRLNFKIDRNTLINVTTGAVYMRAFSEHVMRSAN